MSASGLTLATADMPLGYFITSDKPLRGAVPPWLPDTAQGRAEASQNGFADMRVREFSTDLPGHPFAYVEVTLWTSLRGAKWAFKRQMQLHPGDPGATTRVYETQLSLGETYGDESFAIRRASTPGGTDPGGTWYYAFFRVANAVATIGVTGGSPALAADLARRQAAKLHNNIGK